MSNVANVVKADEPVPKQLANVTQLVEQPIQLPFVLALSKRVRVKTKVSIVELVEKVAFSIACQELLVQIEHEPCTHCTRLEQLRSLTTSQLSVGQIDAYQATNSESGKNGVAEINTSLNTNSEYRSDILKTLHRLAQTPPDTRSTLARFRTNARLIRGSSGRVIVAE